jgi:3',5'-cyclic-AMP phosphodiesterase
MTLRQLPGDCLRAYCSLKDCRISFEVEKNGSFNNYRITVTVTLVFFMLNMAPFSNTENKISKTLAWLTDLHLDAAEEYQIQQLLLDITALNTDIILVGGDTCNGTKAFNYLLSIAKMTEKEVYFVLGNHEFYHHSITQVRKLAQQLSDTHPQLHYLTKESIIELTPTTALIGHDGWSDARAGDFMHSTILLHDYTLISELRNLDKSKLKLKLNQLGTQAAQNIKKKLEGAFKSYTNIILLTHTPPFQAACIYDKHISDDNWAPHFVCKAMGDMLFKMMKENPDKQVAVYCGHAHHMADISLLPNLKVMVGESILGSPQIQGIITV